MLWQVETSVAFISRTLQYIEEISYAGVQATHQSALYFITALITLYNPTLTITARCWANIIYWLFMILGSTLMYSYDSSYVGTSVTSVSPFTIPTSRCCCLATAEVEFEVALKYFIFLD